MKFEPKLKRYKNGVEVRLYNKRTSVFTSGEGVGVRFVRMLGKDESLEPNSAKSAILKKKVLLTEIKLSKDAAKYLAVALTQYIEHFE